MMAGHLKKSGIVIKRCLVAAAVLLASFLLDGPAKETRDLVIEVVPGWLLRSLAHGGEVVTLAAVVAALFACGLVMSRSRLTRAALVLASALAATALVVLSVKWLASRGGDGVFHGFGRGGEQGIMFPSGHTAIAFAACAILGMVWRKARWPVCAIAVGVAVSRATLIHFLSDVVAGALTGSVVGRGVAEWAAMQGFLELDYRPQAAQASNSAAQAAE
jgi:membrane-associated phospholipid phosphatase